MKRRINFTLFALATFVGYVLNSSCHRQDLEYEFTEVLHIPISVKWEKIEMNPQNVTVLVYDEVTGMLIKEHIYSNNNEKIQSYIDLPIGKYTIVLFNEIRDQIDYVRIKGHENLSTLTAHIVRNSSPLINSDDDEYVNEPGILAAQLISNIEITKEMIGNNFYYKSKQNNLAIKDKKLPTMLMGIVPERKVGLCKVKIHIKGLNKTRVPILVDLKRIASEYQFANDQNIKSSAQQTLFNNSTFDSKTSTDGTVYGEIYLFGVLGEKRAIENLLKKNPLKMTIRLMLKNKEKTICKYNFDLINCVSCKRELNSSTTINIEAVLNEIIPDVVLEEEKGSSFDTELTDWGVINVPLINK